MVGQHLVVNEREIPSSFSDHSSQMEVVHFLDSVQPHLPVPAFAKYQNKPLGLQNAHLKHFSNHSVYTWRINTPNFNTRILLDELTLNIGDTLFTYSLDGDLLETTISSSTLGNSFVTVPSNRGMILQLKNYSNSAFAHISGYSLELRNEPKNRSDEFGDSYECQVNVNCQEGQDHRDIQRSVVRIFLKLGSSISWCTGSVVNNTNYDYKPYLLTAEHCGLVGSQIASQSDIDLWTFYFNYESSGCNNPDQEGDLNSQRITGATVLANSNDRGGDLGSDFLLLKLSRPIPDSFNVYYAGWNRQEEAIPQEGVGIHHPNGDIKKISTYWNPVTDGSFGGFVSNTHWIVEWSSTLNGHGTTEGGSSGSPLFDEHGLIRGVLTGGGSGCDNLDGPDLYGKFSRGWNSHGSESNRRLDVWLDPGNTGFLALNGANKGETAPLPNNDDLSVYPVPAAGNKLFLRDLGSPQDDIRIDLFDALGKVLYSGNFVVVPGEDNSIDISGLVNGFYLLRIHKNGQISERKFTVSRT